MKIGFMCEVDHAYELPMGLGAFLFPTIAAAHKYCTSQVQVEVIPIATLGAEYAGGRSRRPYFMREADVYAKGPFSEAGVFITDSIEGMWRTTSSEQRRLVAVRLRVIQTFDRSGSRLPADAFVYEEIYERLGLLHPGVWTKH